MFEWSRILYILRMILIEGLYWNETTHSSVKYIYIGFESKSSLIQSFLPVFYEKWKGMKQTT